MKKIFLLLFSFQCLLIFAQQKFEFKDNHFPARYVLKNSNDTISSRIMNVGVIKMTKFSVHTIVKKMRFYEPNGEKKTVKEEDLQYLEITDLEGNVHKYYSSLNYLPKESGLVEVLFDGNKIDYVRDFYISNIYGNINSIDYFIDRKRDEIKKNNWGIRKTLNDTFAEYPDLQARLKDEKSHYEVIALLQEYDNR